MAIMRDKLWIFGARAHQDDIYLFNNPETTKTIPTSRITPAEAALMLDAIGSVIVAVYLIYCGIKTIKESTQKEVMK